MLGHGGWELWLGTGGPEARAQGPAHRLPAVRLQASPLLLSCPLSISQTAETSPGSEPSGECGVSQREPGDLCGLQHALSKRQVLPRSPGRDCPHRALGREDAGCAGVPRVAWGERRSRSFPGPPTWLQSPRPQPLQETPSGHVLLRPPPRPPDLASSSQRPFPGGINRRAP